MNRQQVLKLLGYGAICRSDLRTANLAVPIPEDSAVLLFYVIAQIVGYIRDELA